MTADDSAIVSVVQATHAAVEITWGATHTELRLTRTGPRVIEIGARPGGDLIPLLVRLVTGRDQVVEAAAAVCGWTSCHARGDRRRRAGGRRDPLLLPRGGEQAGGSLSGPEDQVCSLAVRFHARGGTRDRAPNAAARFPDRIGFAVVRAESADRCQRHLDSFESGLAITCDPSADAICSPPGSAKKEDSLPTTY